MTEANIIIQAGDQQRQIVLRDQPFSIGRHPTNGYVTNDDLVSRRHCMIQPCAGGHEVIDLGSRNGIKLNGRKVVRSATLQSGDILMIGGIVVQYVTNGVQKIEDNQFTPIVSTPTAKPVSEAPLETVAKSNHEASSSVNADAKPSPRKNVAKPKVAKPKKESKNSDLHLQLLFRELGNLIQAQRQLPFHAEEINLQNNRNQVVGGDDESDLSGLHLVRLILMLSIQTRTTDIHLEPARDNYSMRVRIDGMMVTLASMHSRVGLRMVNTIKILCELDITQKQTIQEGHFSAELPDRAVDYRVSFTPVMGGQKLVIRVLDLANAPTRISDLHLPPVANKTVRQTIRRDSGMILTCGPTGSGKTTTMYAIIREIDAAVRNIITIEDPVEYQIPGVTQMPIDMQQGNTFTTLLRAVLRQDPDVILLGEIRDAETAQIAMQAAVTGHLVMSTVHAKDVIGALFRIMDLGVDNQLIASAVNVVIAQRLVRQLCPRCKKSVKLKARDLLELRKTSHELKNVYRAVGCVHCLQTGYIGRVGLFEMMEATSKIRDVLLTQPTVNDIREALDATMFQSLRDNGYRLVTSGKTSLEELERVTEGT